MPYTLNGLKEFLKIQKLGKNAKFAESSNQQKQVIKVLHVLNYKLQT